jgi:hypothetical protein
LQNWRLLHQDCSRRKWRSPEAGAAKPCVSRVFGIALRI